MGPEYANSYLRGDFVTLFRCHCDKQITNVDQLQIFQASGASQYTFHVFFFTISLFSTNYSMMERLTVAIAVFQV